MSTSDSGLAVSECLDERFLIDTLVELAKVPTDVPLGPQTFMEPDDPKLPTWEGSGWSPDTM